MLPERTAVRSGHSGRHPADRTGEAPGVQRSRPRSLHPEGTGHSQVGRSALSWPRSCENSRPGQTMDGQIHAARDRPPGSRSASRAALEWIGLAAILIALAGYTTLQLRASREEIEATERSRLAHQARIVEQMLGTRLEATSNALDALRADVPALLAGTGGVSLLNERMKRDGLVHGRRAHVHPGEPGRDRSRQQPEGAHRHRLPRGGTVPHHPEPSRRLRAVRLPTVPDSARELGAQPRPGHPRRAGRLRRLPPRHHRPGVLQPPARFDALRARHVGRVDPRRWAGHLPGARTEGCDRDEPRREAGRPVPPAHPERQERHLVDGCPPDHPQGRPDRLPDHPTIEEPVGRLPGRLVHPGNRRHVRPVAERAAGPRHPARRGRRCLEPRPVLPTSGGGPPSPGSVRPRRRSGRSRRAPCDGAPPSSRPSSTPCRPRCGSRATPRGR